MDLLDTVRAGLSLLGIMPLGSGATGCGLTGKSRFLVAREDQEGHCLCHCGYTNWRPSLKLTRPI